MAKRKKGPASDRDGGPQPKRRRLSPEDRRGELLDAGRRVLKAKGADARVEDVTEEAAAAKGTFYVYFRTWTEFLATIRDEADDFVAEKFGELSAEYLDWRSVLFAFPKLHLQLVRALDGLEVIYTIPFESDAPDIKNLERTVAFFEEAARAGAIKTDSPQLAGRLVYRMITGTTEAILAGLEQEAACDICGHFIVTALEAKPLPRTDVFMTGTTAEAARGESE